MCKTALCGFCVCVCVGCAQIGTTSECNTSHLHPSPFAIHLFTTVLHISHSCCITHTQDIYGGPYGAQLCHEILFSIFN